MKRSYVLTFSACVAMILLSLLLHLVFFPVQEQRTIKVGLIYEGDYITPYTDNFIDAQEYVETLYGDQIETVTKYNIKESNVEQPLQELVDAQCDVIIANSFGYGDKVKEYAAMYPDIEFYQATCANANGDPVCNNYHNFMGSIYEGRYVTGIVAGMKLKEMIDQGLITKDQAVVGYVAAFPYAEVISGYTAFFLGVRSVVPNATMMVKYTNTWNNYVTEKNIASELIDQGCVVISQHSDTTGPAVACENAKTDYPVYHVGYNKSVTAVAPSSSLVCCNINYAPYFEAIIKAELSGKKVESIVDANTNGLDSYAGFDKNWVRILDINETIAAKGTQQAVDEAIEQFQEGKINVFQGPYKGIDPFDPTDVIDLSAGYTENDGCSAPTFHYVLEDVITVLE